MSDGPTVDPDRSTTRSPPFEPDIWFAAGKNLLTPTPQITSLYVLVPENVAWTATLSTGSDWLTIDSPIDGKGIGPDLLTLSVDTPNTGPEKQGELLVSLAGGVPLFRRRVRQFSGVPLHTLNTSVLAVPFPSTPRVMELGIAGKFIGTELQKIPREILGIPVRLIVVIIVDLLLILLGILVILLRLLAALLDPGLRESRTWLPPPQQPTPTLNRIVQLTTQNVPVTTVYLLQEVYLLVIYVAEVALSK